MSDVERQLREMQKDVRGLQRQVGQLVTLLKANMGDVLSIDEAALLTGYSRSYLYKLTRSGQLPCYRPTRRRIFIDRETLINWIKQEGEEKIWN